MERNRQARKQILLVIPAHKLTTEALLGAQEIVAFQKVIKQLQEHIRRLIRNSEISLKKYDRIMAVIKELQQAFHAELEAIENRAPLRGNRWHIWWAEVRAFWWPKLER